MSISFSWTFLLTSHWRKRNVASGFLLAPLITVREGSASAEVRRRVEGLLESQEPGGRQAPQALRQVRAVEVLESAGTPEARQLLEALARGVAGARLTREARAALDRVGR